jgi:hypothetical protein
MRLIKQVTLYFKEGNSDKVYEIDLCDVGNDKYVVNFRYGRRGSPLKEGSKTPIPVSLSEAENIYASVAAEKTDKGYTPMESSQAPTTATSSFSLTIPASATLINNGASLPAGRHKAILQRLQQAVEASATPRRKPWKLSRVIWKAGEYKIKEAGPAIIQLFSKGDTLHQYVCTWALIRCVHEAAVEVLPFIHKDHPSPLVRRIAGAGLIGLLSGDDRNQHLVQYLDGLPENMKGAIQTNQVKVLETLLTDSIKQAAPGYAWLENIYLLSIEQRWLRPLLKKNLLQAPLQPNYFKHIRAIYKLAEVLDDFEITGLLGGRLERDTEMFAHHVSGKDLETEIDLDEVDDFINPHIELKRKNSRLAYSQKTRWYLHRRIRRRLKMLGNTGNTDYVKLATALLIAYKKDLDFKEAFATSSREWNGRSYITLETRYPQNAQLVLLHELLSGDHPELELIKGQVWQMRSIKKISPSQQGGISSSQQSGGLLKKLIGLFGQKKTASPAQPAASQAAAQSAPNENGTPYLHLWNQLPQSFLQLLIEAELEEIHEFAHGALTIHPQFQEIKGKLDVPVYKRLLLSPFILPAEFGYTLAVEKYAYLQPQGELVTAMLNSALEKARHKGKEWAIAGQVDYFHQSEFIKDLLFVQHNDIRQWARELIRNRSINPDIRKAAVGKAIAEMMSATLPAGRITDASDGLIELFNPEIQEVPLAIIGDLLQHTQAPVVLFGLKLLKLQRQQANADALNKSILFDLLRRDDAAVRAAGISLLELVSSPELVKHQEALIVACYSTYRDVRQGLAPLIGRLAKDEPSFGHLAAETFMPSLLRKETTEGLHSDISRLLCNELSDYLQNANKETALNLLYGNYKAAQDVGVMILEKYTNPDQLTIPQVIALGGHENLNVRAWSWKFYREQAPRIRFEKEAAVKLLESKWQDTRQFAMQYFREQFTMADWSPEALITLADSVKPDVEAFGRELITKFFDGEHGQQYLLQLSQHPSEKMQLFATNYLERYAADDVARISSLEFYIRSVLTRVNKGRVAKNRIYQFLLTEGRKSGEAAKVVSGILSDVSATGAIGDKAKCIEVLLQLKSLYEVETPLTLKPFVTRMASS